MLSTKLLTLSLLLVTGSFSLPQPITTETETETLPLALDARACDYTCGSVCYTTSAANSAKSAGYSLHSSGETVGSNDYPHVYNNYEGFDFPVSGTYYEFPILSSGAIYNGGSPGADRVVFNGNNQLAGLITHTGASGNAFVSC